ncbi:hypothetical protein [Pectinatus frisingensis]|uniref:hypothetical protein n=1 Tax=Pectinatus frisingensis TaxID=865 RepID=UPI0018C66602|nr:hypothetical protein [Pectinatus frisingensis]
MADENIKNTETTNQMAQQSAQPAVNDDKAAIKADILKMKTAKSDLEAKGANLFADEIKNLEQKIENAEKELAAKTEETVTTAETEVSSWWDKHRTDIFNVVKIAALIYIAVRLTM